MKIKMLLTASAVTAAFAISALAAPQASLTLQNCDTKICYKNNTEWTLTKEVKEGDNTVVDGVGTIKWTVTATKGAVSDNIIEVNGYLTIANTGSADATIGNIVINLQKRAVCGTPTWVSAAADMADATVGDAATKATIAKAASQEDPACNASVGANNYTTPPWNGAGGPGVFIKTAGSGLVQFTDDNWNTAYSLVPQKVIPPGGSVSLLWRATFNNTVLGLAAGAQVRTETIVTFGNAGGRGDSGASTADLDIDGSGVLDPDEAHVRSVPCRISLELPALIECNKTVTLADTDPDSITLPGEANTVTWGNFTTTIGGGSGIELISDTVTRTVSVDVNGGDEGGSICNLAGLSGDDCNAAPCSLTVGGFTFKCCTPVSLTAQSCVDVGPGGGGNYEKGDYCSYTQGGWGNKAAGNNVGSLLANNFATVYGVNGQVVIGGNKTVTFKTKTSVVHETANTQSALDKAIALGAYNVVIHYKTVGQGNQVFDYAEYDLGVTVTAVEAITAFLPQGGTPGVLTENLENPTSTSAGVFAGQVLALKLNVDFSAAVPPVTPSGLGALKLCNTGSSLDGKTIAEILAAANTALGGGALPSGYSYSTLNDLIDNLNQAFDGCTPTDWAQTYLCK